MTKPKKIGIVLLTAGAVLVIAALLLFSHNRAEDRRAGESAEETLRLVEAAMAERETNGETGTTPAPGDGEPDAAATAANAPGASASPGAAAAGTETGSGGLPAPPALDMPTVHSGAYDYIGYLDFPGYGLTMPVAATWSFPALEISPCRHTGSVYNDNLVVAGHNYSTHFGVLFELQLGDIVTFTDVDGNAFTYRAGTDRRFPGRFGRRDEQRLRTYALHLQLGHDEARHRLLRAHQRGGVNTWYEENRVWI